MSSFIPVYKLSEKFPKKRAFITGAGSGLGRAFALELARDGWTLAISDIRQDRIDNVASEVEGLGGKAFPFVFDVADKEAYRKIAHDVTQHIGLDILINNAGVGEGGLFSECKLEDFEWVLGINQMGVIYGCHLFLPYLKKQGSGHIINISSAASFSNLPRMSAYNMGKAAVLSLSETLHGELKADGIGISVATPTFFQTNIMEQCRGDKDSQEMGQMMVDRSNLSPEQVAATILKKAGKGQFQIYVTGQAYGVHWLARMFPGLWRMLRARGANDTERIKKLLAKK